MTHTDSETWLNSRQVRQRYGDTSDMSIWRWLRDDRLKFPKPMYINGRRFWKLSDLQAFDLSRKTEAA